MSQLPKFIPYMRWESLVHDHVGSDDTLVEGTEDDTAVSEGCWAGDAVDCAALHRLHPISSAKRAIVDCLKLFMIVVRRRPLEWRGLAHVTSLMDSPHVYSLLRGLCEYKAGALDGSHRTC